MSLTQAIREYNQEQGATKKRGPFDNALTTFRRFSSSFHKAREAGQVSGKAFKEIKQLLDQLEQRLSELQK